MTMAKIIELIFTEERRGTGSDDNPVYLAPQLWTKDGRLVADAELKDGKIIGYFFTNELSVKTIRE